MTGVPRAMVLGVCVCATAACYRDQEEAGLYGGGGASSVVLPAEKATPDAGPVAMVDCTFTVSSTVSAKIPTVGIVTWSTSLPDITWAEIGFGLDTSYGMAAPITNPSGSESNTTLLLGMKQKRTYHYRITVSDGTRGCVSDDYTITTGTLPNGLPTITASTPVPSSLFGGFLITGQFVSFAGGMSAPAYIVDADADIVWAYSPGRDVTCAVMSYDGKYMWINANNVPNTTPNVHRVTMDGLTDENLSSKFVGQSHQLTVLPDDTVAFFAYGSNGCEDIKEYAPNGEVRTIANAGAAQGQTSGCHVNNVQYSEEDDTLVFSDLYHQSVVKVRRSDGSTVWTLNGATSDFSGELWKGGQHGIHILGVDDFVIFNNNSKNMFGTMTAFGGTGDGSMAVEVKLSLSAKTAKKTWWYKGVPKVQIETLGDLQRLANGNTVVGYSTAGVLHEVAPDGTLVQSLKWPLGSSFGYIQKRRSLYGVPPR